MTMWVSLVYLCYTFEAYVCSIGNDIRAKHVTKGMVLLNDLNRSGVWYFRIFGYLDTVKRKPTKVWFFQSRSFLPFLWLYARLLAIFEHVNFVSIGSGQDDDDKERINLSETHKLVSLDE